MLAFYVMYPSIGASQCACLDVNITLETGCTIVAYPAMIGSCDTGIVQVQDSNPSNGNIIDGPGSWPYTLTDSSGVLICMGTILAEDKSGPVISYYQLPCTGDISQSYAAFQTATFMSTDVLQVYNQDRSWQDDSYAYFSGAPNFTDGCLIASGCLSETKIYDLLTYFSCTDPLWVNDRVFARIDRTFFSVDCMGNTTRVQQQILFKTPRLNPNLLLPIQNAFQNRTLTLNGVACSQTAAQMIDQFKSATYPSFINGVPQPKLIFQDPYHCSPSTETYSIFPEPVIYGLAKKYLNNRMSFSVRLVAEDPNCTDGRRISTQILGLDWCTGTSLILADNLTLKLGYLSSTANLSASTNAITADAPAGTYPLGIQSNTIWSLDDDMYWVTLSQTQGQNNANIQVTLAANTSPLPRSGRIFLTAPGMGTQVITVVQRGATLQILNVLPESISFGSGGGTAPLQIEASGAWTASETASWLTLGTVQGSGNTTLQLSCLPNTTGVTRIALVQVVSNGQVKQATITQEAASALLTFSPSSLNFLGTGGTAFLEIQSNASWILTEKPSWLTVNRTSGQNSGTIEVNCAPNSGELARTGNLVFLCNGTLTKTVLVSQAGRTAALLLSKTTFNLPASASTDSFEVRTAGNWTAVSSASWLTISPSAGTGNTTLRFQVPDNTELASRSAIIQITGPNGIQTTATITQAGVAPFVEADADTIYFSQKGGVDTLQITANTSWTLSELMHWLQLSAVRGRNSSTIYVSCTTNESTSTRSADIVLNGSGVRTKLIRVIQLPIAPQITVTPQQLTFSGSGDSASVTVVSNVNWRAQTSATWLTASPENGTGGNSTRVVIRAAARLDSTSRTGTVTFSAGGLNGVTVNVTQQAPSVALFMRSDTLYFPETGGRDSLSIWATASWHAKTTASWIVLSDTIGVGSSKLYFQCLPNTVSSGREAVIEVRGNDGFSRKLIIRQVGTVPTLQAQLEQSIFPETAGNTTLAIRSNQTWTISGAPAWLTLSAVSGTGNQNVRIDYAPNAQNLERTATLVLSAPGVNPIRFELSQRGGTPFLRVQETTLQVPAEGGVFSLIVYSNITWRTSELVSWLQVTPASGSLTDTLILKILPRAASTPRSGVLTIYGPGVSSVKVTIQQLGVAIEGPGAFQISQPSTGVSEDSRLFLAYPNPGSDLITLSFIQPIQESFTLVVRDIQGRTMLSQKYPKGNLNGTQILLPVSKFPEGIYTVTLSGATMHYVEKIQVRRAQ